MHNDNLGYLPNYYGDDLGIIPVVVGTAISKAGAIAGAAGKAIGFVKGIFGGGGEVQNPVSAAEFIAAWRSAPSSAKIAMERAVPPANQKDWTLQKIDNNLVEFVKGVNGGSDGKITTTSGRALHDAAHDFVNRYYRGGGAPVSIAPVAYPTASPAGDVYGTSPTSTNHPVLKTPKASGAVPVPKPGAAPSTTMMPAALAGMSPAVLAMIGVGAFMLLKRR